ncbi:glycosyltransferase [Weissella hellenica]|nr:glycosyltransferase [Weissella hellenica]
MNKSVGKIFFTTSTLPKIHGGRTKSLLQRARLLNMEGVDITLVSTNYNSEYQSIYDFFRETNRILDNTSFINIYDYYKCLATVVGNKHNWKDILTRCVDDVSNYVVVRRSSKNGRTYYYHNGVPKFVIKKFDNGQLDFFALYRDWNFEPYKYFYINKEGFVHRVDTYNEIGKLIKQDYLTDNGKRYLSKNIKTNKFYLYLENDAIEFDNEKKFIAYFFNQIFSLNDVVVNDARLLDKSLLESHVGKRIFQLHNSHLSDPMDSNSGIKGSFKSILNTNFSKDDVIVTLTEQQKLDIISELPNLKNNIIVIPHSTKPVKLTYSKNNNHFGAICRLHPQKNLQDTIQAFYLFDKEKPGYYLDIFGDGESRHELELMVKRLQLVDKVIFHGNVQNVNQAYQSIFTLLITSKYEGFALNAMESLANGTPVITYKVNYGPTNIIDNTSGWVATERTPEALKNKMLIAVDNPKDKYIVQKRINIFSEEKFISKWLGVIKNG